MRVEGLPLFDGDAQRLAVENRRAEFFPLRRVGFEELEVRCGVEDQVKKLVERLFTA